MFDTVLNDWGFDLVKLDFLYATAVVPLHNKTRGQLAYESIDFLRECVGNKQILGCGVQQMPCFGKVEYMRIGADMDLGWKHKFSAISLTGKMFQPRMPSTTACIEDA